MSTFVLVHGAWHGAWCWERVEAHLHDTGHRTVAPTLVGLGERASELTPEVGLRDHVDDVVAVLQASAEPVVLVGHSYSGFVVREAADAAPDRVERLVLLDAWFGPDGCSLFDVAPEWFRRALEQMAAEGGDGWTVPPPPPDMVGVADPDDQAWLTRNLTPHPITTFSQPTTLTGAIDAVPASAIVVDPSILPFRSFALDAGLPTTTLHTGHDAMVTAPAQLAAVLAADPTQPG